jgi:hypothetical protein
VRTSVKGVSDKGLLSKIHKELLKLNKKNMNSWIKDGSEQIPHQRRYPDGKQVFEKIPTPCAIREI